MKGIMIAGLALIFVAAVPFTILGESKGKDSRRAWSAQAGSFCVDNPNHTQVLGGRSEHDRFGLAEAAEHSRKVHRVDPTPSDGTSSSGGTTSGGGITGGTSGTVTSSGPGTLQ